MLEEKFDEYTSNYDLNNIHLKSKYNHSYRVMNLCEKYAKELGWSDDDIKLARIIGLLHDYGRFEQYKRYESFIDKDTIDHADLSVEELFDKNEIVNFTDRKEDYNLIKFAIKNHNKLTITGSDDERYIRFAKLIRDADKVDIMYTFSGERKKIATNDKIKDVVYKYIKEHKIVPRIYTDNENERILIDFGFVFDLNYDVVLNDYKTNFINFYNNIENNSIFEEAYKEVINYINERIDNNVRD